MTASSSAAMSRTFIWLLLVATLATGCLTSAQTEYAYAVPAGTDPELKACVLRCEGYTEMPLDFQSMGPSGGFQGRKAQRFLSCLQRCGNGRVVRATCVDLTPDPGTWCYPVIRTSVVVDEDATDAFVAGILTDGDHDDANDARPRKRSDASPQRETPSTNSSNRRQRHDSSSAPPRNDKRRPTEPSTQKRRLTEPSTQKRHLTEPSTQKRRPAKPSAQKRRPAKPSTQRRRPSEPYAQKRRSQ